jgi:hypothetical protein
MPEGFRFPDSQDIWTVYLPTKEREEMGHFELMLFGMLKPGASLTQANGELALISTRLAKDLPEADKELIAHAQTFHDQFNGGPIKLIFLLMLGAVGFVLLIACANVANMMLSRAIARSRELAVRAAVGASRWQLIRQMLVESVLLSMLGGLLGLWLSTFGVKAFDLATQDVSRTGSSSRWTGAPSRTSGSSPWPAASSSGCCRPCARPAPTSTPRSRTARRAPAAAAAGSRPRSWSSSSPPPSCCWPAPA